MTKSNLIEKTFQLQKASVEFLLLLRIVFDTAPEKSTLSTDIYDLLTFPERLYDSYADEWRCWIKRRIQQGAFHDDSQSAPEALTRYLEDNYLPKKNIINQQYQEFLQVINHTKLVANAGNVKILKSKFRQQIEKLAN